MSEGIVYIDPAYAIPVDDGDVEVYWENGPSQAVGPVGTDLDAAILWARKRAPEVLVRIDRAIFSHQFVRVGGLTVRLDAPVEHRRQDYSAGDVHEPSRDVRPWPGDRGTVEPLEAGYGGYAMVYQRETQPVGDDLGFTARHEVLDGTGSRLSELVGPKWLADLSGAVAWARSRATYVLISSGPPLYEYWSAGSARLPIAGLPNWPEWDVSDGGDRESAEAGGLRISIPTAQGRSFPTGDD
jgi:hypothetical protein